MIEPKEAAVAFADKPYTLREFKVKGKLLEDEDKLSLRLRILQEESEQAFFMLETFSSCSRDEKIPSSLLIKCKACLPSATLHWLPLRS